MNLSKEIAIIGAGSLGLSMAIFFYELGYKRKIFDKKIKISKYSKALGVNPKTLEIFKPLGNDFAKIKSDYPFMLIQPKIESEEILLEEVQSRGMQVEYNSEFVKFNKTELKYTCQIIGNENLNDEFDYIIGADGGRSKIREQIGIQYKGYRYDAEWEIT